MAKYKNLENEYRRWKNSAATELWEVYPSGCSTEKHEAMENCLRWYVEDEGERFRIVSHSGWTFSVGWVYKDKESGKKMFRYETYRNSYIWEVQE